MEQEDFLRDATFQQCKSVLAKISQQIVVLSRDAPNLAILRNFLQHILYALTRIATVLGEDETSQDQIHTFEQALDEIEFARTLANYINRSARPLEGEPIVQELSEAIESYKSLLVTLQNSFEGTSRTYGNSFLSILLI